MLKSLLLRPIKVTICLRKANNGAVGGRFGAVRLNGEIVSGKI